MGGSSPNRRETGRWVDTVRPVFRRKQKGDPDMPDIPGDKPPGCGCLSLMLVLVLGLSVVLLLAIQAQEPDRDAAGNHQEPGPLAVTSLRVGDCVDVDPRSTTVQGMAASPCTDPHDAQVYATGYLPEGEWPGEDAVSAAVSGRCADELTDVVDGQTYEVLQLEPIATDWPGGRGYSCLLQSADGSRLTAEIETVSTPG
jgi:hypothetical protein